MKLVKVGGVFLALLAMVSGCEQDHPLLAPPRGGVIRGWVGDGAPIDGVFTVQATSVGPGPAVQVTDHVDLAGHFALRVPNGKYQLAIQPVGWGQIYFGTDRPVLSSSDADTVTVAGDEQEANFACGHVIFEIDLPASLEGAGMSGRVEMADQSWLSREGNGTVSDGLRLVVRFVPPGWHRLLIGGGGLARIYLPPTFDSEAADVIEVVAGQGYVHSARIEALATLSGSVTGSWQTFGSDPPSVRAYVAYQSVGSSTVAADGSFSLAFLAGARLRLQVWNAQVRRWVGGGDHDTATLFELEPGGAITGIDDVESGLECVLTGDLDSQDAIATIYDASFRQMGWLRSAGDTLRIPNLRPGSVYLRLRPQSDLTRWLPQYLDRKDSLAVADAIPIPDDGQVAHVVATVVRGGRIRGRILDAMGQPPSGNWFWISLHAPADSAEIIRSYDLGNATYDAVTGDYVLNQVPAGTFKLRAQAMTARAWWPHASCFADAGTVTVGAQEEVEGVDWQLLPDGPTAPPVPAPRSSIPTACRVP